MARTTLTVTISPELHRYAIQNNIGFSSTLDAALAILREQEYGNIADAFRAQVRVAEKLGYQVQMLQAHIAEKEGHATLVALNNAAEVRRLLQKEQGGA